MLNRLESVVLCSVLAVVVLAGCSKGLVTGLKSSGNGDNIKQAEAPLVFRLAENQPEDYPTTLGDKEFARLVNERTNGRIKIEVYSGGQLGKEISVTEQLQYGAVDFARLSVSSLSEVEKSMGALMLPYLYRDKDHMFKVLEGPIGEKILGSLEKSAGIVGLCWLDAGTRNFYNSKKEIKSPDDMKGLIIRSQETALMMDFVKIVGALPVAMAYGDVYSALQTGVIDGAENNWPSFEASRHYEVAKFITTDEHTRIPELILASKMVMNKLSAEDQEIIKGAAREAALFQRAEWLRREEISREKVESSGVKITTLQSNDAFKEKIKGLYDKHEKEYKAVIDEILNTK
jgi:tripartite ATP-independent transporter DctP family solute receptor